MITVPDLVRSGDAVCVVSLSGGKDSVATSLALREADVPARYTAERRRRNESGEGNFDHPIATFFQSRASDGHPMGIDEQVAWARSNRGSRQLTMIGMPPDGGCFRWGLCEPPERDDDGTT